MQVIFENIKKKEMLNSNVSTYSILGSYSHYSPYPFSLYALSLYLVIHYILGDITYATKIKTLSRALQNGQYLYCLSFLYLFIIYCHKYDIGYVINMI